MANNDQDDNTRDTDLMRDMEDRDLENMQQDFGDEDQAA